MMSIERLSEFGPFASFIGIALALACLVGLGRIIGSKISGRIALCLAAVLATVLAWGGYTFYVASISPLPQPQAAPLLYVIVPALLGFGLLLGALQKHLEMRMNSRHEK